jgi:hypothetical protein
MNPEATTEVASVTSLVPGVPATRTCRSQREVLLEILRCAAQRDAWLTLEEMARETNFPPASISAQLRHLRKPRYGAWKIQRQQRKSGKAQLLWEYRLGS